ncbi:MAG: alpha/beta fold hydrolase [Ktedonobacterales bacterium]
MHTVISRDGTTIAFDQVGTGPALILVGGAFQQREDQLFGPLAALLAPHFTVITYDRRGRGDSGDTLPYAAEREVEDIAALITAAGGSAYVFGNSSGGNLALEAAARKLPITKLAIYEAPFTANDANDGQPREPDDFATQLNALLAAGRRGDAVAHFLTKAVGIPAEVVAQMRHAPMWSGMEAIAPTLAYDTAITEDTTLLTERAPSVTIPTLVLYGGASPAWASNSAQAAVSALPNAQSRALEGQTHNVSAEALAPVLQAFFAQ